MDKTFLAFIFLVQLIQVVSYFKNSVDPDHLTPSTQLNMLPENILFLFVFLLYVPSQQLWSWGTVSSPNHTFSWAGLNKR